MERARQIHTVNVGSPWYDLSPDEVNVSEITCNGTKNMHFRENPQSFASGT